MLARRLVTLIKIGLGRNVMKSEENQIHDDVELNPGPNADSVAEIKQYIKPEIMSLYEVYSYRHAAAVLKNFLMN